MHLKTISELVDFCVVVLILKTEENMQHFWHIMLYYFKKCKNIIETQKKKTCAVCGEGAVTERTCQKRFARFRAGDFLPDNARRSDGPVGVDSNQTETFIENNRRSTSWER